MSRLLVTFLLLNSVCFGDEERPVVQTPLGNIKGVYQISSKGQKFAAFEGIPYAAPPIGSRRFEAPEPIEPWHGTWDAQHLIQCAQYNIFNTAESGDEDCLYINVYVPGDPKPGQNLNVIVHIHGGGYMIGSGHMFEGQNFLMNKNVIFVTFNYRLGIFGFLSTEDEVVPGNNGMKDQVLALKWIQKNIAGFGGNPNSVTLTGLSAGGASVHLHYLSEMSRGLFHRGFSQSGTALNTWSLQKNALGKAKRLGALLGCPLSNTKILVECLKQKSYKQIIEKLSLFYSYSFLPIGIFGPVVEKGSNAFLKEHMYSLLKKGNVYDVPWLVSSSSHEGYTPQFSNTDVNKYLNENWETLAPIFLEFNHTLDQSKWTSTVQKIKEFYCPKNSIDEECFTYMFGDRIFQADIEESVKLQSKAIKSPVYYYQFAYPGDTGNQKFIGHGAESKYYYGPNAFVPQPLTKDELKMSEIFLNFLIYFSKTGIPKMNGVDLKPTKSDQLTYLNVAGFKPEDMKLKTVDEIAAVKFWKSLEFQENENLVFVKDEL